MSILNQKKISELNNSENYYHEIHENIEFIINKYNEIVKEYLELIFANVRTKNIYLKFIIVRGLNTLNSVFNFILYFTKNVEITYFYSQKSIYFYVEFISQIINDENILLQLNTKDAVMYVYKKTIFEINKTYVKPTNTSSHKLSIIKEYMTASENILYKILNNDFIENCKLNQVKNNPYLIKFDKILVMLILFAENKDIKLLHLFIHRINNLDIKDFLHYIYLLLSKIKNTLHFQNNISSELFNDQLLNETPENFIKWVIC